MTASETSICSFRAKLCGSVGESRGRSFSLSVWCDCKLPSGASVGQFIRCFATAGLYFNPLTAPARKLSRDERCTHVRLQTVYLSGL